MKTDKMDIFASIGDQDLKIATAYSKGIAYIIAERLKDVYLHTADRLTVRTQAGHIEYTLFIETVKEGD